MPSFYRSENDIVIQTFAIGDLSFKEEYRTGVPTETWKPSAISFGTSSLVLGAMKEAPFILFEISTKRFEVLRPDVVFVVSKTKAVSAKPHNTQNEVAVNSNQLKSPPKSVENLKKNEKDAIKQDKVTETAKCQSVSQESKMRKTSHERKSTKNENNNGKTGRKDSWFRKWL